MSFFKKVWDKIKAPRGFLLALSLILTISVIAGTIVLVVLVQKQTVWHFVLYIASAISLAYLIYLIVYLTPIVKRKVKKKMGKYKFTNNLISSYGYRAFVFAVCSFVINVAYAVFMGIYAIIARSAWFGIFAIYYLILSSMRGGVLLTKRKHDPTKESKQYLTVAIMLLILTLATALIVMATYRFTVVSRYKGLIIYCSAAYTFYKLCLAIYNMVKAKRQDNLLVEAVKDISFADAIVSIFVLQVSMIQAFSVDGGANLMLFNGITGALVCAGIVAIAVLMIVKYAKVKKEKQYEEE